MTTTLDQLKELIANGLTLSDCIKTFSADNDEDAERFIELARDKWVEEGSIEIDDSTVTAGSSDHGDYVMAWVWVADPRPNPEDDEDDDENED